MSEGIEDAVFMFVTKIAFTAKCQMAIAKKMSESSETGGDLGNSIRTLVDAVVEFDRDLTGLEEDDACKNESRNSLFGSL
jgi:hypothetical protein